MDAQRCIYMLSDLADDPCDITGKCTPVGITENECIRSGPLGSTKDLDGILRIVLVAVKKVFGVVDQLLVMAFDKPDGGADDLQILLRLDTEGFIHMEQPSLPEESDHRCVRLDQCGEVFVQIGRAAC